MADTGIDVEAPPLNTHVRLDALLSRIIEEPERRQQISEEIERDFTQRRAVLVLDMSGFSRTTQLHGVVTFLLMIHQMRLLAAPTIRAFGGKLVKAEADNLFCLFESVDAAVRASREIITRLNGREGDRGSTSGMVHNCYAIVSGISKYATLHPGDIILTGAPGAVEQINPGDVVEVEIPGIGILRNPVIGEA